jgi:farnesyl-diphosphate farnesyltransferase
VTDNLFDGRDGKTRLFLVSFPTLIVEGKTQSQTSTGHPNHLWAHSFKVASVWRIRVVDLTLLLRISSRTFSIGIERLPKQMANAITIAYLLLRVSDYIEDDGDIESSKKVELLNQWGNVLIGQEKAQSLVENMVFSEKLTPDAHVAKEVVPLIEALSQLPDIPKAMIIQHVHASTMGMAYWVNRGPQIENEQDMDNYMHEVAGRVGFLVTKLFAIYSKSVKSRIDHLLPLARECGLALQTVNVIRGLKKDYERGWIYVPESYCAAVDISRDELFDPQYQEQALQVVDMLVTKADGHLKSAREYFKILPQWKHAIRLSCLYPLLFAVRTLAISRKNSQVLEGGAKISREEVKRIVRDSTLWGWSNSWVESYIQRLEAAEPI